MKNLGRNGGRSTSGRFPLDILPIPARDLAEAAASSIGCPVDFPAVAILATASALIGRSASILVKPRYFESASLHVALVGSPSSGKSPSLRAALAPVREIIQELYEAWRAEMPEWEAKPEKERGPAPILKRIITTEALATILAFNPRGLAVTPHEMTKWVMSMDQYKGGKGGDRPFYLSAWGGEGVIIDRAKFMREPIMVPHPFLTVVGGMTSGMLTELSESKGREDGFTASLLFTYPEKVARPHSELGVPDETSGDWGRLARALWDRPMREMDGRSVPFVVTMSHDARNDWAAWCQAHRDEQEASDFADALEGPWGKLEAYAARLALILFLMDLAADPTERAPDDPPPMPRRFIADAACLVAYFKGHTLRVRAAMGGKCSDGDENVRALLGWVGRNRMAEFTRRDVARNFDRFKADESALDDALGWMRVHNLIRPLATPDGRKPGRKHSPTFGTNPELWRSPRFRRSRQDGPDIVGNDSRSAGIAATSDCARMRHHATLRQRRLEPTMASIFKKDRRMGMPWFIDYSVEYGKRKRVKGCADRGVTEQIARKLESEVELQRRGVIDPRDDARAVQSARSVADHLAHLTAKGATAKHSALTLERAWRVVALAKGAALAVVTPKRITDGGREEFAKRADGFVQSARPSALATLRDSGMSLQSVNHYRAAIRGFSRWAWRAGPTVDDALAGVSGMNAKEGRRHDRRPLAVGDLCRLIEASHRGPAYRDMDGPTRAICSRLAVATGLRFSEFPLADRGATMIRLDLDAAGISYRDDAGLVFDTHSLRCQCATLADQAGISPRVVQRLMRHSTLELTGRYTRPRVADLEPATDALSKLAPPGPDRSTSGRYRDRFDPECYRQCYRRGRVRTRAVARHCDCVKRLAEL